MGQEGPGELIAGNQEVFQEGQGGIFEEGQGGGGQQGGSNQQAGGDQQAGGGQQGGGSQQSGGGHLADTGGLPLVPLAGAVAGALLLGTGILTFSIARRSSL